ncbi:MAG TPA: hypothetical protein VNU45_08505 [Rummeliibacillus sp.]|nr:hypothetical protein [Rummeliibacillus sp.]
MNFSVLKDLKTVFGFFISILFGIIAILLAINSNDYWVVFVVIEVILMFFSVNRADKI